MSTKLASKLYYMGQVITGLFDYAMREYEENPNGEGNLTLLEYAYTRLDWFNRVVRRMAEFQ